MKRIRIKNIYKFARSVSILLGIVMIAMMLFSKTSLSHINKEMVEYKIVNVVSGDTLWNIAAKQQNNPYYEGKDIREIIYDIKKVNTLKNSNLMVGQELKIPML